MHFTGRTWRPPYEAHSVIIQAASGCTYNKCRFCSLYRNEGLFVPAEEKERIRELQILINNLNIRTHLFANTVSNFTPVTAYLRAQMKIV